VALLEIRDVSKRFGGVRALDGVSLACEEGRICGLIGPNGSGKTTLFNTISAIYRPDGGEIVFAGTSLAGMARHRVAALGIGRTFQNLALFRTLSVADNVLTGAFLLERSGFLANTLRLGRVRREEQADAARLASVLDLLDLGAVAGRLVGSLPFATQKRVELARALIGQPRLVLLDEPAAGLNHEEVDALETLLRTIRDRLGVAILLVEHHMNLVMRVSDRVVALDFGRKIAEGTPDAVRASPAVIEAYLGSPAHSAAA